MLDDEEGMQVLQCVTSPMDLLTMLYKVSGSIFVAVSLWFFVCQTHDTCEVRALRSALSAGCHDHVRPSGKVCIRLCSRTDL